MNRFLPALVALLLIAPPAHAQQVYAAQPSAQQLVDTPALLVDIRRPEEWVQTGVLPNAVLLTYEHFSSPEEFLDALAPHMQPGQPVALICRTGNRTSRAARALAERMDVPVIDVMGGMFRLMGAGYSPERPTSAQGCTIC